LESLLPSNHVYKTQVHQDLDLLSDNHLFTLDNNGTLKTATTFDYETNASTYTIGVQVINKFYTSLVKKFTITLLDINNSTSINNTNFITAMDLWFSNQGVSEDNYGNIIDWNLSDVSLSGFTFSNAEKGRIHEVLGSNPTWSIDWREFVDINDTNFHTAVDMWFDNWKDANATYGHITDWNTSAVTNMNRAFYNRSDFNENVGNWDTSSVINMASMFSGAHSFNQPIGSWDTSSVTDMRWMFMGASSFNQPIGDWNTSKVGFLRSMFRQATSFNQPIGSWDTSLVTDMTRLFWSATAFDQSIADWNISSVEAFYEIFTGANELSKENKGLIHQAFSSKSDWSYDWSQFVPPRNLSPLAQLSISENQPIASVVGEFNATDANDGNITYHFVNGENNNSLFILDTNGTLKTTTTFDYENNASSYTITVQAKDELNASIEGNFTVSLLDVNLSTPLNDSNFMSAINLWFSNQAVAKDHYGHISEWNVSSVTNMTGAFKNRTDFNKNIGNWDTSAVINMSKIFSGASTFNQPIGEWDTSSVTTMSYMFHEALAFNQPIGNWNTSSVTSMDRMFHGVDAFDQSLEDWNVSNVSDFTYMWKLPNPLSNSNKRLIHENFSQNQNWSFYWSPFIPPRNLAFLATLSILENQPIGTIVGEFNSTDANEGTISYHLINGENNNSLFTLDANGTLKTATTFDYESNASTYTITVQAKDEYNATTEGNFTVTIVDQNDAPYELNSTAPLRIYENQPVGTIVGKLTAKDQDEGDRLIYKLVRDREQIDNELFTLDENGALRTASIFDYERNQTFHIRVKVLDMAGLMRKESFHIGVLNVMEDNDGDGEEDHFDPDDDNDGSSDAEELAYGSDPLDVASLVNQRPSGLVMRGGSFLENEPNGTFVARFVGVDADQNDTLSYTLVRPSATPGDDAHRVNFEIEGILSYIEIEGGFWGITDLHGNKYIPINLQNEIKITEEKFIKVSKAFKKENQVSIWMWGTLIYCEEWELLDPENEWHKERSLDENQTEIQESIEFPFRLSKLGGLRTLRTFDYESDESNYPLTVRVTDEHNTSYDQTFTVHLINVIEDIDGDGKEDAFDEDMDGDGFTNAEEIAYGSDPLNLHSIANKAPDFLELNGSAILENQPKGTIIGRLIGHDPDPNSTLIYAQLLEGNQTQSPLFVSPTGVVRTTRIFDYETNDHNYSLVARVSDEHNFSKERSFTIHLINQIEDLDKDGVEDFYDEDLDGDGFTNKDEITFGSDPLDADSVINRKPDDITMMGGRIKENEPVGTVVARFLGMDADGNESLTFSLIEYRNEWDFHRTVQIDDANKSGRAIEDSYDRNDSQSTEFNSTKADKSDPNNSNSFYPLSDTNSSDASIFKNESTDNLPKYTSPFVLSTRGLLRTNRILDFERDPSMHYVKIQVTDEDNASIDRNFSIRLINVIEDIDEDGTEDFYDEDMDGDGFSNIDEIAEGTNPKDQYSSPKKPILFTNNGSRDENGSFILNGGVLTNGQGSISDFGFVLSPKISVDEDSLWIRGKGKPRDFTLVIDKLPFEPVMYFRAWAKNIAGYGIGPVKKVRMEETSQTWWGVVYERPGNWMSSNWFGNFKYYEQGWLYHDRLGWLYASPAEGNSVWIWKEGRGWLWTQESAWPYLWWNKRKDWLYLVPGKVGQPPRFYDYSIMDYR
jgi:surface protein